MCLCNASSAISSGEKRFTSGGSSEIRTIDVTTTLITLTYYGWVNIFNFNFNFFWARWFGSDGFNMLSQIFNDNMLNACWTLKLSWSERFLRILYSSVRSPEVNLLESFKEPFFSPWYFFIQIYYFTTPWIQKSCDVMEGWRILRHLCAQPKNVYLH